MQYRVIATRSPGLSRIGGSSRALPPSCVCPNSYSCSTPNFLPLSPTTPFSIVVRRSNCSPMARIPISTVRKYLLGGQISTAGCLGRQQLTSRWLPHEVQFVHTIAEPTEAIREVPFQKRLKDEARQRKLEARSNPTAKSKNQALENWELTVGIEIHAQLNTARKLFSSAPSSIDDAPNTNVALFDVAMPGSEPSFQKATLIPAIRAALALNCEIQRTSKFDRKHYFHWDQPAGYQITQYYEPFAKDGFITLFSHDGIAKEDGESIRIGIKQVQLEQDTAKTSTRLGNEHLVDFNRAGLPLIEIITLPQIRYPQTAAALVRKVQMILNSVDACVLGLQSGGLRADVNVSVRERHQKNGSIQNHQYGGIKGLGQRTEIKNLSSFKAVEDAIIAERDRQIGVLEAGGIIEGETRGWTIGGTETKRLRGKEGEVDYRYMPDPDLHPLIIGQDLIDRLQSTIGILPDEEVQELVRNYGLTIKDSMSLVSLNDGGRAAYFWKVFEEIESLQGSAEPKSTGRLVGNWVLHELGGLVSDASESDNALKMTPDGGCIIPHTSLAHLLHYLLCNKITGKSAKNLLLRLFENGHLGETADVKSIIDAEGWWFSPLDHAEYEALARSIWDEQVVAEILSGKEGKINFLVGKMMRADKDGRVQPLEATKVLSRMIQAQKRQSSSS